MRTLLLSLVITLSLSAFSQNDTAILKLSDTVSLQQSIDSANDYLKELRSREWEERNVAGLKLLKEQQKAYKEKEKKRAMIRIGIGVLFLIVLIIGLRRKTKKTAS
jgi:hypothetical protein